MQFFMMWFYRLGKIATLEATNILPPELTVGLTWGEKLRQFRNEYKLLEMRKKLAEFKEKFSATTKLQKMWFHSLIKLTTGRYTCMIFWLIWINILFILTINFFEGFMALCPVVYVTEKKMKLQKLIGFHKYRHCNILPVPSVLFFPFRSVCKSLVLEVLELVCWYTSACTLGGYTTAQLPSSYGIG